MEGERLARAKEIFQSVLDSGPEARHGIVERRCGEDAELRRFVRRLLANFESGMGSFLVPAAQDDLATIGPGTAPATDPRVGQTISHFAIRSRLGAGGMGEVYRADDLALGRSVALKLLPPGLRPSIRQRLLREAWASARLQHPAIATFHEAGCEDGIDFIAMELVRGVTLRERLRAGPLEADEAIGIGATLLEALVHAHAAGILHRDIKPENLMVTDEGQLKLLDFGLAKGLLMEEAAAEEPAGSVGGSDQVAPANDTRAIPDAEVATMEVPAESDGSRPGTPSSALVGEPVALTRAGTIMGTPGYMPPEQLRGESVDERADVFAAGTVLYEMLAGKPAFPGTSVGDRLRAVKTRDPDPLPQILAADLRAVVMRALHRDPRERPETARAFLDVLRPQRAGNDRAEPIELAILDLEGPDGEGGDGWIGTALPDAIAQRLSRLERLRVHRRAGTTDATRGTARTGESAEKDRPGLYRSLAVSGSFSLADSEEVAVSVHLRDAVNGHVVLDERFRAPMERLPELEARFATAVAASLGLHAPETTDAPRRLEAYRNHARARRIVSTADRTHFEQARVLLERAIHLEPGYAQALALLGQLHAWNFHSTSEADDLTRADECTRKAVEADPMSADVLAWRAYVLLLLREDVEAADFLRRSMQADPTAYFPAYLGTGLRVVGRPREESLRIVEAVGGPAELEDPHDWLRRDGLRLAQRVVELEPRVRWGWLSLGWTHLELRHFEEARWCASRAVELEPKTDPPTGGIVGFLGECLRREGEPAQARVFFLEALAAVERTDYMYRDTWRALFLCGLGRAALDEDDEGAARTAFTQAQLHLQGRPGTRCGGHFMVQALAGAAESGGNPGPLDEALRLFERRDRYDFTLSWGGSDDVDLLALSRAATALDRHDVGRKLLRRAVDHGSSEADADTRTANAAGQDP